MATPATGGPVLAANAVLDDDDDDDAVTESQAPSHILQDGRFVILPDPTPAEHRRFVERSIARHGLLQHDLKQGGSPRKSTAQAQLGGGDDDEDENKEEEGDEDDDDEQKDAATQQVHPLVLASARLTNDGINELNRAINLATLVQTNEYFGMSNIVADSALELASTEAAAAAADKGEGGGGDKKEKKTSASAATGSTGSGTAQSTNNNNTSASNSANNNNNNNTNNNSSQRSIQATFVLKRKLAQFRQAASQLRTHQARLEAAIVAEHRPLARLRQLRPHWRWVAPEHGTRAAPHATRPTEVLCADVDLYHVVVQQQEGEDAGEPSQQQQQQQQPLGRLARRVPRYATLQLKSEYQVELDAEQWRKKMKRTLPEESKSSSTTTTTADAKDEHSVSYSEAALWTRAEPFAIADPTLGKIDADFDPSKVVAMLTLEFAVEKAGVGTTARLEPFGQQEQHQPQQTSSTNAAAVDSQVLVALQHSLFCAKLFDAIRREVASDTEEVGQVRASTASQSERSTIWISSSSSSSASGSTGELFLPPPGSMVRHAIGPPVAVIHCHEGEVMVQLDCEYTLRIKLVEATTLDAAPATATTDDDKDDDDDDAQRWPLRALCRALMWHAQQVYHDHSLQQDRLRKAQDERDRAARQRQQSSFALKRKAPQQTSPRILSECIGLGSKWLLERRLRVTLAAVAAWVEEAAQQPQQQASQQASSSSSQATTRRLHTEWLSSSVLAPQAQFTVSLTGTPWYVDASLHGDRLTVTSFVPQYRKVDFHSEHELELFLRQALWSYLSK